MHDARTINVLIVDEHPVTRWGLRHFLETRHNIRVVGEAGCLTEAFDQVRRRKPDVIMMDFVLPDGDGVAALNDLLEDKSTRALAFSAYDTWDYVEKFLKAGGSGFVTKRCPPDELIAAIEAVSQDRQWISPSVRNVPSGSGRGGRRGADNLSPRELEVVTLVARGLTSRQIAGQLCVSLKTIETHRYRIFKELQIKSRAQLVNYAIQHGLLGTYASQSSNPAQGV